MGFQIGDEVTWQSQSGGSFKTKTGVVVQVVPRMEYPKPLPKHYGGGMWRGHESYVIDCRKSLNHKPDTYWPVVAKLRPLTPQPEGLEG